MAVDVAGLKATVSIADVVGRYVELKRNGRELRGICPFHNDRRPSLAVVPHKEMFYCHGCGVGGDAIAFVRRIEGCTFERAVEILGAQKTDRKMIPFPRVMPAEVVRKCYAPPLESAAQPDMRIQPNEDPPHPWKLAKTWTYYGTRREVLYYVGRYEWWDAAGDLWKSYRAFTYADDGWRCQHWQAPRPLYNLHNLTHDPDLPVCLVEGEKSADAAGVLGAGRWVASTWPGGSHAVPKADLSSLKGRKVFVWPDADAAGSDALEALLERLRDVASEVWVFNVADMPEKWDAANALEDDGWNTARLEGWIIETVGGEPRLRQHDYDAAAVPAGILDPGPPPDLSEPVMRPSPRGNNDVEQSAMHWENASWRSKLIINVGKNGAKDVAVRCVENACMPLTHAAEWKGLLAWDELRQRITTTRPTPWGEQPEEWADHHDTALTCWYDRTRMFYGGLIHQAVDLVAHRNAFHPVRDYLKSLEWDGEPRLNTWLTTYCGSPNNEFTNFVGAAWMISAVARAMQPGAQVKTCLILFGVQDAGKSEAFRVLGTPWYAVQHGNVGGDSTKAIEQCSKTWILEMSELTRLKRTDDIESLKSFISTYEDTYRPAYARRVMTIPRCNVFCGTSNSNEVFTDPSGNVRFWPVQVCDQIDVETLRADRDQLWAEATARYKQGERWWIEDTRMKQAAQEATDAFVVRDPWETDIAIWLDQPEQRLKRDQGGAHATVDIMSGPLRIEIKNFNQADQRRVANCMRKLGYVYRTVRYTPQEMMGKEAGAAQYWRGWKNNNWEEE